MWNVCEWKFVCMCVAAWWHFDAAAVATVLANGVATWKTTWPQLLAVNERQLGDHNKLKIMLPIMEYHRHGDRDGE